MGGWFDPVKMVHGPCTSEKEDHVLWRRKQM